MNLTAINEESLLVKFSDDISEDIHLKVKNMYRYALKIDGVLSVVPSYNSLMIYYDIMTTDYDKLTVDLKKVKNHQVIQSEKRIIKIPVCYEMGIDLKRVSDHTGLSEKAVISNHTGRDYLVYMIGFAPGFPYLGGMDAKLATPRLEVPRTKIEAGSVGIGGEQTGIYPLPTPGGWNIIGKTPLKLYDQNNSQTLLKMGEYIRFVPVSKDENYKIENEVLENKYEIEVVSC